MNQSPQALGPVPIGGSCLLCPEDHQRATVTMMHEPGENDTGWRDLQVFDCGIDLPRRVKENGIAIQSGGGPIHGGSRRGTGNIHSRKVCS